MTAATPTTIRGVSLLTERRRAGAAVFDIALSPDGIEIIRPGQPVQKMTWDRVSQWEIEEHDGYVLLTLRGGGSTTPIVVRDWTLDDLEVVIREVTTGAAGATPTSGLEAVAKPDLAPAPVLTPTPETKASPTAADAEVAPERERRSRERSGARRSRSRRWPRSHRRQRRRQWRSNQSNPDPNGAGSAGAPAASSAPAGRRWPRWRSSASSPPR